MRVGNLAKQPLTRVLVICILLIFISFCGLHLIGAHHDGETDGLALAGGLGVFIVGFALLLSSFAQIFDSPRTAGWRWRSSSDPDGLPFGLVPSHPPQRC